MNPAHIGRGPRPHPKEAEMARGDTPVRIHRQLVSELLDEIMATVQGRNDATPRPERIARIARRLRERRHARAATRAGEGGRE
jgi:hypothetical protein